eukprot:gene4400-5409_t
MAVLVTKLPKQYKSVVTDVGQQKQPTLDGFCTEDGALKEERRNEADRQRVQQDRHTAEKCRLVNKDALEACYKNHAENEKNEAENLEEVFMAYVANSNGDIVRYDWDIVEPSWIYRVHPEEETDTGVVDEVIMEAQFVNASSFNRMSTVRLRDALGLYAKLSDRTLYMSPVLVDTDLTLGTDQSYTAVSI